MLPLLTQVFLAGLLVLAIRRRQNEMILEQARLDALRVSLEADAARRAAELKASENRFQEFCECSPVGIFVTDAYGNCTYTNDRWVEMSGLSAATSAGIGWMAAFHPDDIAGYKTAWDAAVADGREFSARARLRAGSSVRWVQARARPVHDGSGRPRGWVGAIQDVTQQQEYEESLRAAHAKALEASRAKSEFMASLSHEIRTPMNGVIGMTGLLLDTPLAPEQREYAQVVRRSGETLLGLINDILDFSKIEAGKLEIEPVPFDLLTIVEECVEAQALAAADRGLELVLSFHPGTPRQVVGDSGRIRQILTNLLSNALKFTHRGRVVLSVHATGQRFAFEVEDTGIGIPPSKLEVIFERFTQADGSTTRHYGGTGLGLAICRQLAGLMGGSVTARSVLGAGSTFTLALELAVRADAPPADLGVLVGRRALVVDDDEVNRRVLSEQLTAAGLTVTACASAAAALAHGTGFDIAVLDHQMPERDGVSLARVLRTRVPVLVMLTSLGRRGEARETSDFSAWLTKPVRVSELLTTLARSLAAPAAPVSRPPPAAPPPITHRVLVVEDNPVNQVVATRMLEQAGCRVDVASNGQEALEMVHLLPYDAVFMDCQMPEMDGFEATRALRGLPAPLSLTPVIGLTARALAGDREECLEAGMDDVLTKPVTRENVAAALSRWVAPPFDRARVDELQRDFGEDVYADLLLLFNQHAVAECARLITASACGAQPEVARIAHGIKGAALQVGADAAARAARELETIHTRTPQDVPILVRGLRRELARVA